MSDEEVKDAQPDSPTTEENGIPAGRREDIAALASDPATTFLYVAAIRDGKPVFFIGGRLAQDPAVAIASSSFVALLGHDPQLVLRGITAVSGIMSKRVAASKPLIIVPGGAN
jgi:hypothetical protein